MSFSKIVSSDSEQIEKARQDLQLACEEAADRAQQEQQRQEQKQQQTREREQEQEQQLQLQAIMPDKDRQTELISQEVNVEPESNAPDQFPQNNQNTSISDHSPKTTENLNTSPNVSDQSQHQKAILPYQNHNPFVEDILRQIVSEDIDRLRRQETREE